ncbi:Glycosyl hydrolase family 30 beta sandwich domain [Trinorchestia longiramus]|nr:Glycosyl hydrolase family 30 beta sandwich domain [Trinorchestia longiramus]
MKHCALNALWISSLFLTVAAASEECDGDGCGERHNAWTSTGGCNQRAFTWDSFVCVCSGTSCDLPGPIPHPDDAASYTVVTTDRQQLRFAVTQNSPVTLPAEGSRLMRINTNIQYQEMLGFGGAVSDSAGLSFFSLGEDSQNNLIRSYFGPDGISYNMVRIPIAGSDFSTRTYSYDDHEGDDKLERFALAEEDLMYKIPLLLRAKSLAAETSELLMFASPWSPPAWMKTNGKFHGSGALRAEMGRPYANYICRFLQEYAKRGLDMWGITTQNEPLSGREEWPFNTCLFEAPVLREWMAEHLLPVLQEASLLDRLNIMISDQGRDYLSKYSDEVLQHDTLSKKVAGIAIHWYQDTDDNVQALTQTRALFPDQFTLHTEACMGFDSPPGEKVKLGDWGRAERYAESIIENSNHGTSGWVDWNMALDMEGGPNWVSNFVDAPIIVDANKDTFYKQPMFYALGHFSKFVARGARAVYHSLLTEAPSGLQASAFRNPDGGVVVVLLNTDETEAAVSIQPQMSESKYFNIVMPPKSIKSVLYRQS